jgi:hypothetical protein
MLLSLLKQRTAVSPQIKPKSQRNRHKTLFLSFAIVEQANRTIGRDELQTKIRVCSSCRGVNPMEFDRNRYFMVGVLLCLLGIQFRMVESFVLNESSTRALARMAKNSQIASQDFGTTLYMNVYPSPKKSVKPPSWLGWALLSTGGVICLHAMVLPKNKK